MSGGPAGPCWEKSTLFYRIITPDFSKFKGFGKVPKLTQHAASSTQERAPGSFLWLSADSLTSSSQKP